MGIGKQAKTLTAKQVEGVLAYLERSRTPVRNRAIFLLSVKAGLRAKEIAHLRWSMVLDSDGELSETLHLTNEASKGSSGRQIPLNRQLRRAMLDLLNREKSRPDFRFSDFVVRTQRASKTSAQAVINMFFSWYSDLGMVGCSSHSGRRTFISNGARKISLVGGSLRDIQALAGHANLQTTQRYIEFDSESQKKVVELV